MQIGVARRLVLVVSVLFASIVTTQGSSGRGESHAQRQPLKRSPDANFLRLPLSFEPNEGQTDGRVKFLSRGGGYTLFLTGDEAVLHLRSFVPEEGPQSAGRVARRTSKLATGRLNHPTSRRADTTDGGRRTAETLLRMRLVGADADATVAGENQLPGKSNYLVGNDPRKWRIDVPTYAKVRYQAVYPGVDLVYYGNEQQLEYDFVVAPGADPRAIQMRFDGAEDPTVDAANGDLVLKGDAGEVRFRKPVVYQPATLASARRTVDGRYVLDAHDRISFAVSAFDSTRPLIIDPKLSYSTLLGGSLTDAAATSVSIAVDSSGNAYVASGTTSVNFPVTAGARQKTYAGAAACSEWYTCGDAIVAKIDPTGSTLVYSTYLGGNYDDYAYGIAVDAAGNAFVGGVTESTDFPTSPGAFQAAYAGGQDNFVAKLNPTGSGLVYSTYLGGSGQDSPQALAIDSSGNAYIAGQTFSGDFPLASPYQPTYGGYGNAFVSKLNAGGTALVYSTYLGGTGGDGAVGLTVNTADEAYVTGSTGSADFPVSPGAFQATINPTICGSAATYIFQCNNAFVSKFNSAGTALLYSTFFGGSGVTYSNTIVTDAAGRAYISGLTSAPDFPTTNGAFQTTYGGGSCVKYWCGDAFVAKFDPAQSGAGSLVYSTFLGGPNDDAATGTAVDSAGHVYVTGGSTSNNFPVLKPVQGTNGGGNDGFVVEFNAAGSGLIYSTLLGGTGTDAPDFIAVDAQGNAYVAGFTDSLGFPTTPGAFQTTFAGGARDLFVAKISPLDNTPSGTSVAIQPINGVSLGFDSIITPGTTSVSQSSTGMAPPQGFSLGSPATYFELSTTASFAGSVSVCLSYAGVTFPGGTPQLFHYEGGAWVDVTTSVDTANHVVCGSVTSLSPFALFSAPTVATVQPPIEADGSSVFKAKRGVVPVKFSLATGGSPTCQLPPATISVVRKSGLTETSVNESVYTSASDAGSYFRISSCQYHYNLSTDSFGAGTYTVNISVGGNVAGGATFGLK